MVTTHRLTYQDYADLEGDERYELLDGRLVPVPSRNTAHQTVSIRLMTEMYFFVKENGLGRLYPAPFDVLFTDFDVVQPDLLLICGDRKHIITPDNVQGAPDLIVEILSPCDVEDGLARQAGTVRPPRRQGVLDRRPHAPDSVGTTAPGRRARDHTDLHRGRRCRLRGPRGLQRQPGGAFRGVTIPCGSRRDRLGESPARGIPSARGAGAPPQL